MGLFEDVGTGIYDFASDRMDNINKKISDINDFAREHIPGVREVEGAIHGAYDWGMDQLRSFETYSKIEKELEKKHHKNLVCAS